MASDGRETTPAGKVSGRAVRPILAGVRELSPESREVAQAALDAHGLAAADTEDWFPLAALCGAVADIDDRIGSDTTRALGACVARAVTVDAHTVPDALAALDEAYRSSHRGDVGGYAFRRIGDRDGRVECATPYPCPFDRGFVERVAAAGADGPIRLSEVGACRGDGAPRCTYDLRW
jgi:hypothetical protein